MASDWDPFDDIQLEPVGGNARAGAKFRPKLKPQPRKEKHATVTTNPTNVPVDTPITSATQTSDVMSSTTALTDSLPKLIQNQELVNSTAVFHPGPSLPDGDNNSSPMDISSQLLIEKEYADHGDAMHSELPNSDTHGDLQPGLERSKKENTDIFAGLDDIFHESTTANVSTVRKYQPKVKVNEQLENEVPTSRIVADEAEGSISHAEDSIFHASNAKGLEGDPDRSPLSFANCSTLQPCSFPPTEDSPGLLSQQAVDGRDSGAFEYEQDFMIDDERLGTEDQTYPGLESLNVVSQATTTVTSQPVPSEIEYMSDDLHATSIDYGLGEFSTINIPDPEGPDHPYEFGVGEGLAHHADASGSSANSREDVIEPQAMSTISGKEGTRSRKRKISVASERSVRKYLSGNAGELSQVSLDERPSEEAEEGNKSGKRIRQRRKRSTVNETEGGNEEDENLHADDPNYSLEDNDACIDGDNEHLKDTSRRKGASKTKPTTQIEKAGRRRKKSSEGPDSVNKEPPKKKFPHSTRRNKRQVNKALIDTPEDEIDPRKLPIRDLIFLGELREQRWKKDAAVSKNSLPNQSANDTFADDTPYDEDDPFASMKDLNHDDAEASRPKLNYHSFMKKSAKKRWSKQDTELFYEAIRQFGTDFTMIEQLFPDLDPDGGRRQLVLKFKNEERKHPMKIHEAISHRSKDHSYFERVIEKIQQEQREQNSDRDVESVGISGEAEEEGSPVANEVVEQKEVTNALEKKEEGLEVTEQEIEEHEIGGGDDDDDDFKWSPYNSE